MTSATLDHVTLDAAQQAQFDALMSATYDRVLKMAFRLCHDAADAEDLTQEAFCRAFRSFDAYDGKWPFESWIYRIVTRLHLDMLRARRRRVHAVSYDALAGTGGEDGWHFETADDRPNPEQCLLGRSWSEDLVAVLSSLTSEQRMILRLADVEDMPYQEIADMLGKPIGTIRSRLHRTHKLLGDRLEKVRRRADREPETGMKSVKSATRRKAPASRCIGGRPVRVSSSRSLLPEKLAS